MTSELDRIFSEIIADPTAYNAAQSANHDDDADSLTAKGEEQRNDICRELHNCIATIRNLACWLGLDASQNEEDAEDAINRAICNWSLKTPISKHNSAAGLMNYLRTVAMNDLRKLRNEESRQTRFERNAIAASSVGDDCKLDVPAESVPHDDVEHCEKVELLTKLLGDAKLDILYLRAVGVSPKSIACRTNTTSEPLELRARRINYAIDRIAELMDDLFGSGHRGNARKDEAVRSLWQSKRKEVESFIEERGTKVDFKDGFHFAPSDLLSHEPSGCFIAVPQQMYEKFLGHVYLDAKSQRYASEDS